MELINQTTCLTKHIGVNGNMFGGEVMSLIDLSAATYASEVCRYPKMVTVKITETLFKKPIKVGHLIKLYAAVKEIGNTSITIEMEVRAHNVRTGKQEVVCETNITFVKIDEDGSPIPINTSVKELYPDKLKNETKKEQKEIAALLEEIAKLKKEQKDKISKTNSTFEKKIERIKKHATFYMNNDKAKKEQLAEYHKLVYDLIKTKRLTSEEANSYITKKPYGKDKNSNNK